MYVKNLRQEMLKRQAIGPLVFVDKEIFFAMAHKDDEGLIVYTNPRIFNKRYTYMMSVKGLTFILLSKEKIDMPPHLQLLHVELIELPDRPTPEKWQLLLLFIAIIFLVTTILIILKRFKMW